MSEPRSGLQVSPGSGTPITARGRSIAYGPPPWQMRGRTLAMWYRLTDPDEARRHVPASVRMDDDPIVRARFWDLEHDGLTAAAERDGAWRSFREAVVAFPASHGAVSGDYATYMYADDFAYTSFGREVMGWPVRDGVIEVDPEPAGGPGADMSVGARLERDGQTIMTAQLELSGEQVAVDDAVLPRWLTTKIITDVTGPRAQIAQLVATGPERLQRRVWNASASLDFAEGVGDELHFLRPREIVDAQYWSNVELTVGWGEVLEELGQKAGEDD